MIQGCFEPALPARQLARVQVEVGIGRIPGTPGIVRGTVPFVIDTGSEITCLHPADAIRLFSIHEELLQDASQWPAQSERLGIGGIAVYFLAPSLLTFQHPEAEKQTLDTIIEIAQLTGGDLIVPSILGWDVLQQFALHLDWSQRLVEMS